ncbi:hypothetical protein BJ875DRAFT_436043 [Amylocarpus encephaloides]|uniref:BTB domain-containing protein n=1 Tax=Amylocarpus encephaloides TaxID=45428 RepID=A0A9P8BZE4_9HELO|nr:hypothetical protein BJ875DRAFT_436043 [Amylocarpus encephaloides]
MTIKCGGAVFAAHKIVVLPQSKVLAAAFRNFIEGESGEIDLEEDDPIYVRKMLEFCYKQEYTLGLGEVGSALISHTHLYILGDKYDITPLREHAKANYEEILESTKTQDSKYFLESIETLYEFTCRSDDELRCIAKTVICNRLTEFIMMDSWRDLSDRIANDILAWVARRYILFPKEKLWNVSARNSQTKLGQCPQCKIENKELLQQQPTGWTCRECW